MVANEERVFHRTRRNHEVLAQKGENEEPDYQHRADAGDSLKRGLFHFLFGGCLGRQFEFFGGRIDLVHPVARGRLLLRRHTKKYAPNPRRFPQACQESGQWMMWKMRFQRANPASRAVSSLSCPSLSSEASCASVVDGRRSEK